MRKFSWGNHKSLVDIPKEKVCIPVLFIVHVQGEDIFVALRAFHAAHYSASRMNMCISSAYPLDEVEGWVRLAFRDLIRLDCDHREQFEAVPTSGVGPHSSVEHGLPLPPSASNKMYFVTPVRDVS